MRDCQLINKRKKDEAQGGRDFVCYLTNKEKSRTLLIN